MKVSYNWLKDYLICDCTPDEIADILTNIGLEIESVESFESIKGGLEGLLVGEVLSVEQHPNADKLKCTQVLTGGTETHAIICGAPNVSAGQKVIVAPVGTIIYPTSGDPFTINKARIRGIDSHGMICAEDEIGLGDEHDGIIVLPDDTKIGQPVADLFEVVTDTVFDLSITPNRGDAMSHIGVARDVHAYLQYHKPGSSSLKLPFSNEISIDANDLPISVEIRNTEACPRYSGISLAGIRVAPSPAWMQNRLKAIGVKPISNIVDITNFILHETGQPLHSFDADQIADSKIIVDTQQGGSRFTTLDDMERKVDDEDLMILDPKGGLCFAGVYGGIRSGVTDDTKNVFLESAYFHPVSIRKTAIRHNLRTEAAAHFERCTDPNGTVRVLKRAAALIKELTGARIASDIVDIYPAPVEPVKFEVSYNYLNTIAGTTLPNDEVNRILTGLGIGVEPLDEDKMMVFVPTFKNEVTRPADIAEEVLRIFGYNKLPMPDQLRTTVSVNQTHAGQASSIDQVADLLVSLGYHEMINSSLTPKQNDGAKAVDIMNALSNDMGVMRPDMLGPGLEVVAHNQKRRLLETRLFEFGRVYAKQQDNYTEDTRLAIFQSGPVKPENWKSVAQPTDIYEMKSLVSLLLEKLGLEQINFTETKVHFFEEGMDIIIQGQKCGWFGKLRQSQLNTYDIRQDVFYAEFDWPKLSGLSAKNRLQYNPFSKFPSIRRDLALVIDRGTKYEQIESIANKIGRKILKQVNLFDIYEDPKLGSNKISYAVSFTFEDNEKTLTDKEIDKMMSKMVYQFENQLNATIRS